MRSARQWRAAREVRECVRALAAADLLGVGWPKEYGGRGFSAIEQFIFSEEAHRVNAPIPLVTLNTVGPTLMQCGTEEQKQKFLPAILDGSVEFAIGYSEPGRGKRSGVAAHDRGARRRRLCDQRAEDVHQRRRVRRLHLAGRHAPIRTSRSTRGFRFSSCPPRRRASPGNRCTPCRVSRRSTRSTTMCGCRRARWLGGENQGWQLITTQLNFERAALGNLARSSRCSRRHWTGPAPPSSTRAASSTSRWVQLTLARVEAQVAAYKLVNMRINAAMAKGVLNMGEASAAKVFGTELTQQVARQLLEVLDHNGIRKGDRRATARGPGIGVPVCGHQHVRRRRQRNSA